MKIEDIAQWVDGFRDAFERGQTRPLAWRRGQLEALVRMIEENEEALIAAVQADLGKPRPEAWAIEVQTVLNEAREALRHLKAWNRPRKVSTPLLAQPGRSMVIRTPLGVVLIIAPWNYPVNLLLSPLIGAIAGGNSVVLKPSEVSQNTAALLAKLVPAYLDGEYIGVIEGGVPETTELLKQRFDHIFYTGNGRVGRIVMAAAVQNLTPVTLELGGKSPCYVHNDADIETSARRIVYGKFFNAGQTCIAPDYCLIHEDIFNEMLDALSARVREFYGDDSSKSDSLARIINEQHHRRLCGLMNSGTIVVGGQYDVETKFIAPTILTEVSEDSPVMDEEIFGPILPVLSVKSSKDAIAFINRRPHPLGLYVFSGSRTVQDEVLDNTQSGGVTINHIGFHFLVSGLPFGGVGESGMGAYHGRKSFETFTHERSIVRKPFMVDPNFLYPPYDDEKQAWVKRFL